MANTIQDEIYKNFLEISQQQAAATTQATQSLADLILQADNVRTDLAQQTARTAKASGGSAGSSGSSSTKDGGGGSVLSTVFDIFNSGLGVSPLISGIMGLFGGGDAPAPPPLVKYALPPAINFQAAEVNGRTTNVDYDQAGAPRGYAAPTSPVQTADSGSTGGSGAPQITVNVQAMDARSFMDRSNEIALAVRDAMLNLNAINDVVGEL